ncbi:glucuronate isomerase [Niallia sp. Marseille-Q9988]
MMKVIEEDFLLQNESAKILYHEYSKSMPIIDYHCHLSPKEIAENKSFDNISELWLAGDHYKWRAMRYFGIEEDYITGKASNYEKFQGWAKVLPYCIGNPLYHWSQLELKRYFQIDTVLNEDTCDEIWNICNEKFKQKEYTAQGFIAKSNVEMIGTTDDPLDDLEYHSMIKENSEIKTKVLPSFRPDSLLEINQESFLSYIRNLGKKTNTSITDYEIFLKAIRKRIDYFHLKGCRIADHGLEELPYEECTLGEASRIFLAKLEGATISKQEENKFKTYTFLYLGQLYSSLGWVMQLHIGAKRNNNNRMLQSLGANTGYDSINDFTLARPLNQFLNSLDKDNQLPKTILYSLNPNHGPIIASAAGNFQAAGVKGKIQSGAAWWFNDHKDGMINQMKDLANIGILSTFIGMLTDSRSFLSYTRHEYFRRILCNMLGSWIENGEVPKDYDFIGKLVQDISYFNAKNYFEINRDN